MGLNDAADSNEFDNIRYKGTKSGSAAALLAAIADANNWEGLQSPSPLAGWTNKDGTNFSVGDTAGGAIPEPSSLTVFALLAIAGLVASRRRAKRLR